MTPKKTETKQLPFLTMRIKRELIEEILRVLEFTSTATNTLSTPRRAAYLKGKIEGLLEGYFQPLLQYDNISNADREFLNELNLASEKEFTDATGNKDERSKCSQR